MTWNDNRNFMLMCDMYDNNYAKRYEPDYMRDFYCLFFLSKTSVYKLDKNNLKVKIK